MRARRRAIATLLARDGDLRVPSEVASLAGPLAAVFGGEEPGLNRERLVLELLCLITGELALTLDTYERVLHDPRASKRLAELSRRFDDLAEVSADDLAVESLVADGAAMRSGVTALLPDRLHDAPGNPEAARLLLEAVTADLAPAQARCLTLLFEAWRRQSP